jgi:hypothetical protein
VLPVYLSFGWREVALGLGKGEFKSLGTGGSIGAAFRQCCYPRAFTFFSLLHQGSYCDGVWKAGRLPALGSLFVRMRNTRWVAFSRLL